MSKPFFERLKDYYADVGTALRAEASSAAIFPNTTDVGGSREGVYARFLRQHLPSSCNVMFGGFLFGQDGSESGQLDVIVTGGTALRYDLHNQDGSGKTFACVDGSVAVVSLKSTLDSAQLRDALDNLASIPAKVPLGGQIPQFVRHPDYPDWPLKIIYAPQVRHRV